MHRPRDVATPQSPRACPFHTSDHAFPDRLIAEAKCRASPVLTLVDLTRGEHKVSQPGRPDTARNAACIGAARQAGALNALEILLHSRPPWTTRDSLLGRVVERFPQPPTPSRTRWRSTIEWRKRQSGRRFQFCFLLWVRRAADAAHRETFKLRAFSG
jgi:hypothetical protein